MKSVILYMNNEDLSNTRIGHWEFESLCTYDKAS